MPELTISLLGPFHVTHDGQTVTRFGSDTARAMLAYLVMHPDVAHRRDTLAGLLWPDQPNTAALRNLRVALNRLRNALGDRDTDTPLLEITRQTIQCTTSAHYQLDVQAMRDALDAIKSHAHADSETCAQCVQHRQTIADLYRGDFLTGFALNSPAFEEWMVVERENCHWHALEALSSLTAYYEKQGNYGTAIEYAHRQIELEPWSEEAYRQWMRALALSGHRSAALAQYDTCRTVLAAELGVEPETETRALVEHIREGTLAQVALHPTSNVVQPPPQFPTAPQVTAPLQSAGAPTTTQRAPAFPEGERRVVTVVQAEIGNTEALLTRTGTETWATITSQLLHVIGAEIQRYGGDVDRYDAGGLTAFFGAHVAHEDDPERGVLAALAMQHVFKAQLTGQESGLDDLNLRIGIHTGEVIVTAIEGGNAPDRHTVIGDAMLAADRVMAQTASGTVRVSEATYHLVKPLFTWSTTQHSYTPLAHRQLADKGRGVPGMYSDLVGRNPELHNLNEAVTHLHAGLGGIVTLIGEAGLGKSRLVAEARDLADAQWVEGRCLSYTGTMAYGLWQDVLRGLLGVAADTPPAVINHALREHARALDPERFTATYAYLGKLLGVPLDAEAEALAAQMEGASLQNVTFFAVERFIEQAAQRQPLVIVCEDLHWADPTSLALLERLLALTDRVPLLLVCVFRPYREHGCWHVRETALRAYPHRHTDVQLKPLSTMDGTMLIENLLLSLPGPGGRATVEGLPEAFKAQIHSHSEGNPFYVEEILRALIRSGAIVCEAVTCSWEADEETVEIGIPETLYGVLRSRIDQLPTGARHLLHLASVIGRIFPQRLLAAIAEREGLDTHLVTLQREQLIRERARLPEAEYIFQHQLTLEAAYSGLLQRIRRTLHRRVARAIEQMYAERIDEYLGVLAQHWEQAGDIGRAIAYLRRAGEQAAAQYANQEAIDYFSRALALLPDTDLKAQYAVLLKRVTVYDLIGDREAQRADLKHLQELATALDDRETPGKRRRAQVAVQLTDLYEHTVDYEALATAAHDAVQMARAANDVALAARAHSAQGHAFHVSGDPDNARSQWQQALALARQAGDRHAEAHVLRQLGLAQHTPWEQARAYLEENLRIQREIGNQAGEGDALNALASVHNDAHLPASALTYSVEGTRICQMTGLRREEAWGNLSIAWSYLDLGRFEEADDHAQKAIETFRQVDDFGGESAATIARAWVARATGDEEASRKYAEEAIKLADSVNAGAPAIGARSTLGVILVEKQCWIDAKRIFSEGLEKSELLKMPLGIIYAKSGLARIALAKDNPAQAVAHINEVVQAIENDPTLRGVRAPIQIYLMCYRVLHALDDPRAEAILAQGRRALQGWVAEIEDETLRRSFLENVPENRELLAAFEAMNVPSPTSARRLAEVALREAIYHDHTMGGGEDYVNAAEKAVRMAHAAGDTAMEAEGYLQWGTAVRNLTKTEKVPWALWEKGLAIARENGHLHQEARILRQLSNVTNHPNRFNLAKEYLERNLQIQREIDNQMEEGRALNALAESAMKTQHLAEAKVYAEKGLELCRLTGNRRDETYAVATIGYILLRWGQYADSRLLLQEALHNFRQVGESFGEYFVLLFQSWLAHDIGDYDASQALGEQAMESRAFYTKTAAATSLGNTLSAIGRWPEAAQAYQDSLTWCERFDWPHWSVSAQAGLARVALARDDLRTAQTHAESILDHIETYPELPGSNDPMRIYLMCYRVLHALDDPRANGVLEQGHRLLQDWAAEIEDEALRRSFLENVPENREIVAAYATLHVPTPTSARRFAEVALHEANFYSATQNYAAQADSAQRAVHMAQLAGDTSVEAESWMKSGYALFYHKLDSKNAKAHWEKALNLAREAENQHLEARILREMGVASNNIGQIKEARTYIEQTLGIYVELEDQWGIGRAKNTLGMLALESHHLTEAIGHLEEGLRFCHQTGNRYDEAWGLWHLGTALCRLGRYTAGDEHLRKAYELFRQVEDPWGEIATLYSRGKFARSVGNNAQSLAYVKQALHLTEEFDDVDVHADGWVALGDLQSDEAHWTDAAGTYKKALVSCQKSMWPHRTPNVHARLAYAALSQNEISIAKTHIEYVLNYLETYPELPGSDDPMRVYLICYRVLGALDDERSDDILAQGYRLLQGWATEIDDEALRRSFLENVPENREFIAEYTQK